VHLPAQVLELVRAGVLTMEEVEQVIGIEFNPVRCGFAGGEDVWLTDVLNVGVKPEVLTLAPSTAP
jgi:lycopene cyclase CruP